MAAGLVAGGGRTWASFNRARLAHGVGDKGKPLWSLSKDGTTLAGYRDGSVRYLNHSRKFAVIEGAASGIETANSEWIASGQGLDHRIGPWDHRVAVSA